MNEDEIIAEYESGYVSVWKQANAEFGTVPEAALAKFAKNCRPFGLLFFHESPMYYLSILMLEQSVIVRNGQERMVILGKLQTALEKWYGSRGSISESFLAEQVRDVLQSI